MIRTGIYGGSFNPIHTGHTQLADALCRQGWIDELWFMVSPHNPLKEQEDLLADDDRLKLARLAVEGHGKQFVSDFEFHLPRPSYMVNTLKELQQAYLDREFILVIGADNWQVFDHWYHADEILNRHRIIVYPRPGYDIDTTLLPSGVKMADTPLIDISSTHLRKQIKQGTCLGDYLHPKVWKAIQENGYYRT